MKSIDSKRKSSSKPKKTTKCYLCGGKTRKIDKVRWCEDCKHGQSVYSFSKRVYNVTYAEEFHARANSIVGHNLVTARLQFMAEVVRHEHDDPFTYTLLDFGCATGIFVMRAYSHVFKAQGYDINHAYRRFWQGRKHLYTDLTRVQMPIDILTMFDSLEHVKDPRGLIKYLKPRYIIISIPLVDWVLHDIPIEAITEDRHYKPREHLHYFTTLSLTKLFADLGYDEVMMTSKEIDLGRESVHLIGYKQRDER